jgi:hypothetical protein
MIKLKELIKEETVHSCECGGDCCSVNESKGMELGKIFTGHGFAFKKEELEEGFEKYHLGNLLDSKLKKRLERAIKLWGGKVDAVGMDTIKFRLSSSQLTKLPLLLKKLDQNKNVWIGDKRKKNIWDRKRKIDKLESCGYTMSAEPPHKKLKSSGGTGPEDREFKENLIYVDKDMKDGKFDAKNPQVHISGYGVTNLKTLQDSLSRKFTDLAKKAKKGDVENIEYILKKNGVLMGFVEALVDVNKQLRSPQMKRKITMYKRKR